MKTEIGETFAVIGRLGLVRHGRVCLLCHSAFFLKSINLVLVGDRDLVIHMNCSVVRNLGILKNHVILWNFRELESLGILWRDVIPRSYVIHKSGIGLGVGVHRSQLSKGCKTNFVLICRFQTIMQNKHGMRGFLRRSWLLQFLTLPLSLRLEVGAFLISNPVTSLVARGTG